LGFISFGQHLIAANWIKWCTN